MSRLPTVQATTAATLAEAGFDVIIVEEGSWVEQGSVVPFSRQGHKVATDSGYAASMFD